MSRKYVTTSHMSGKWKKLSRKAENFYSSAKEVIQRNLNNFLISMENEEYDVTLNELCDILNEVYFPTENILFCPNETGDLSFIYILGGEFFYNDRKIKIYLSEYSIDYFLELYSEDIKNYPRNIEGLNSQFWQELFFVLAHEMVHISHLEKSQGKMPFLAYLSLEEYFSDPTEIEAHALDAAKEIVEEGYSETRETYLELFSKSSKVYKRFLKKLSQFIEEENHSCQYQYQQD